MNRTLHALHRWTALLALLQLLVWTGSGAFFAFMPIERVRGEDRAAKRPPAPIDWARVRAAPPEALAGASEATLRMIAARAHWIARKGEARLLVDAETGRATQIDAATAVRIASDDQIGGPFTDVRATRVAEAPLEYRGKLLPAWRVDLHDDRGTRVYVDALSGAVTARRNDLWRVYDYLWGLHIMDWRGRDDHGNRLLQGFAVLGLLTVLTGGVVWIARWRRWRRRGRAVAAAATDQGV